MRKRRGQKILDKIMWEAERIYFHGRPLSDYLRNGALWRMQCWLRGNFSYEYAALAMLLLKWNETATLYHGTIIYRNEHNVEHAWVEFRVGTGRYVLDLSAGEKILYRKGEYFDKGGIGENCRPLWYCTHQKFWAIPYVHNLWEAVQWQETSYVFRDLTGFGKPDSYGVGFEYWIHRGSGLKFSQDGGHMVPYYGESPHKIIATEVIQDFAKKKNRQQPKAKSIRKAEKNYRRANHQNIK